METKKTGWERENRTHFDEIVDNYDKARWDYPDALFADVFAYAGKGRGKKALEIGAGTGKATVPVLSAGYDVTAVEMGANMAAFLHEKCKGYAGFNVLHSTFEDAVLDDGGYDLAYAASAFHWVDARVGCPKVFRLLKKGGVFALMRSNEKTADGDALYEEIQTVYRECYYSYYTSKSRWSRNDNEDLKTPSGILEGFGFTDLKSYHFCDISLSFYNETLTYSADGYVALLDTMADKRALPEDNRKALYKGIAQAIARHGGRYHVDYIFTLYMGRKP